jgi:hypothetical protein
MSLLRYKLRGWRGHSGGNGIIDEYPIRHMLNLETVNTYEERKTFIASRLGVILPGSVRLNERRADRVNVLR